MENVMEQGSVYKRCSRRDEHGGKLGTRCLRLRRPGGAWSPTHGRGATSWNYPSRPMSGAGSCVAPALPSRGR
jgi:hypothetical protein